MTETTEMQSGSDWQRFIRKHKAAFAAFIAAAILAAAGAVYVFVWFTGYAQTTALVPSTLSLWSMNNVVLFLLHGIFWELVLVGIPVGVGAVVGYLWWRHLPQEEKSQYHLSGKGSHSSRAGGAISPLLFIAFALKVFVDGNWNAAIATFTLDYVVGSMITMLEWIAVIFAVPAIVVGVWWLTRQKTKQP